MAYVSLVVSILTGFLGWFLIGACLLSLFWLSSARPSAASLRSLVLGQQKQARRMMPLRDFMDVAQLRGFVFRARPDEYRAFIVQLHLAALAGEIRFWGRECYAGLPTFEEPANLAQIKLMQWADHQLDCVMALHGSSNGQTCVEYQSDEFGIARSAYYDIHLDQVQALHWLRKKLASQTAPSHPQRHQAATIQQAA